MSATLWDEITVRTGGQIWNMVEFYFFSYALSAWAHVEENGWAPLDIASRSRPPGFLLYAGFAIHLDVSNSGGF